MRKWAKLLVAEAVKSALEDPAGPFAATSADEDLAPQHPPRRGERPLLNDSLVLADGDAIRELIDQKNMSLLGLAHKAGDAFCKNTLLKVVGNRGRIKFSTLKAIIKVIDPALDPLDYMISRK